MPFCGYIAASEKYVLPYVQVLRNATAYKQQKSEQQPLESRSERTPNAVCLLQRELTSRTAAVRYRIRNCVTDKHQQAWLPPATPSSEGTFLRNCGLGRAGRPQLGTCAPAGEECQ